MEEEEGGSSADGEAGRRAETGTNGQCRPCSEVERRSKTAYGQSSFPMSVKLRGSHLSPPCVSIM